MKKSSKSTALPKDIDSLTDADFLKLSADQLAALGEHLSNAPAKRMAKTEKQKLHRTLDALRAARGRGRPRVGQGAKSVLVSIEGGLLARADRFAKQQKMSRSQLVAAALEEKMRRKAG